jgi:hypothetical protein
MLVVNVHSFSHQLMKNYLRFHVCSSLSLMTTLYYLSLFEGLVSVIANSVGSVFLPNVT